MSEDNEKALRAQSIQAITEYKEICSRFHNEHNPRSQAGRRYADDLIELLRQDDWRGYAKVAAQYEEGMRQACKEMAQQSTWNTEILRELTKNRTDFAELADLIETGERQTKDGIRFEAYNHRYASITAAAWFTPHTVYLPGTVTPLLGGGPTVTYRRVIYSEEFYETIFTKKESTP